MNTSSAEPKEPGSPTTAHGVKTYLPLSADQRRGIALCLSGGGYRAALFHLGSLRRLNELGILGQIDTITSVSGGSIFTAYLARYLTQIRQQQNDTTGVIPNWENGVAQPLRSFVQRNIRTRAALSRYDPRNWGLWGDPVEALADTYAENISSVHFGDVPTQPRFLICATDMEFGSQWMFDSGLKRVGSNDVGYASPPPDEWSLARAVAASSSFPGVFASVNARTTGDPYRYGGYQERDRGRRITRISLTDGGMYDNLGLEPVWRDHRVVLVSDGGPTYASWQTRSLIWRGLQHPVILLDQATDVRKRWLISNFLSGELSGTYWGMGSLPDNYESSFKAPAYSARLINQRISRVRIDLDAFSDGEIAVVENHGYLMSNIAVRRHMSTLIRNDSPLDVPHSEWMNEERADRALRKSDRISLLGRR